MIETEPPKENGEQEIGKQNKLHTTKFQIEIENQKVEGLVALIITGFYPSPKSFWSCTHVNSCQSYTSYINLHILLNIQCKATLNIQESRKSIKVLKRCQDFIKGQNPLCLVIT